MTPMRDQFEKARDAYEKTRYRGDLASEILGTAGEAHGAKPRAAQRSANVLIIPRRTEVMRWTLAAAAAIALSCGAYFLGTRSAMVSNDIVAENTNNARPIDVTPVKVMPTDQAPMDSTQLASQTEGSQTDDTQELVNDAVADATEFTIVPSLASLSDESDTSGEALNLTFSVPESPMLFSLGTLSEQSEETTQTENKS